MEIAILLGFTAVVLLGLLFHRLRNKLTAMICTGACGFTMYVLSKTIFDQAFPSDLSFYVSLGVSLVVVVIVGFVLMKLTTNK
jgi:hypothetical protein